jgi:hypothetical protein
MVCNLSVLANVAWLQQLEKAEQDRYELQRKLKAVESGSAIAAQKVAFSPVYSYIYPDSYTLIHANSCTKFPQQCLPVHKVYSPVFTLEPCPLVKPKLS